MPFLLDATKNIACSQICSLIWLSLNTVPTFTVRGTGSIYGRLTDTIAFQLGNAVIATAMHANQTFWPDALFLELVGCNFIVKICI
jgi:hypothetical protein